MTFGGTNNNTAEQIQQNRVKTTDPPSSRDTVSGKTFRQIMTTQLHAPEAGRSIPFRVPSTAKLSIFFSQFEEGQWILFSFTGEFSRPDFSGRSAFSSTSAFPSRSEVSRSELSLIVVCTVG